MSGRDQRGDAGRPLSARWMTWAFIGITVVMSGLTLTLPYVVHRIKAAPAHGIVRPAPNRP